MVMKNVSNRHRIGYIQKYDLTQNPHLTERFGFIECPFTRRIFGQRDRVYSKLFYPMDYEEIVDNANMMKKNSGIILVQEPVLLDDDLKDKVIRWVAWANQADPSEYDPFAKKED